MELFTQAGGALAARWLHILAGVTWIGLLYYFNFVQTPSFAQFEAAGRTEAISKLVPRALWWFRWGAAATVASGILILIFNEADGDYFKSASGISISLGMLLGIIMFLNVWGVIWRNQKIVIASANSVLAGNAADPAAADAGRRTLLASRTNTIFSIPLLFFMAFTSHLAPVFGTPDSSGKFWAPVVIIIALFELNALGVIGGIGPSGTKKYLETHKNAIITGLILWALFYLWFEVCFG